MGKKVKFLNRKIGMLTPEQRLRIRYKKRTASITIEHRDSWGDEVRTNQSQQALQMATMSNRSWLVIISLYWSAPNGDYYDQYKYEFQSCTLTDKKSVEKFEALRDHIRSVEKAKGNIAQYVDWGWFATPWESKHKHIEPEEKVLVANFNKD